MEGLHPWDWRAQAEGLQGYPLEDVLRFLGYRRDPDNAARWRRLGAVISINGFMFYDHLGGDGGAGAIELVVHLHQCSVPEAVAFLAQLPPRSARHSSSCLCAPAPHTSLRPQKPPCPERYWPAVRDYLVNECGISDVLLALCRDLGLVHADAQANAVFVRRNTAGQPVGAEILPAEGMRNDAPVGDAGTHSPDPCGAFWMSWELHWPRSVLIAKSALDALSALSLHLLPVTRKGCVVVSTAAVTAWLPAWIEAWNPDRIFCAYDATPHGDHAADRLHRRDYRVVRVRPALDGQDWNDMLRRHRGGEPMDTDDLIFS